MQWVPGKRKWATKGVRETLEDQERDLLLRTRDCTSTSDIKPGGVLKHTHTVGAGEGLYFVTENETRYDKFPFADDDLAGREKQTTTTKKEQKQKQAIRP